MHPHVCQGKNDTAVILVTFCHSARNPGTPTRRTNGRFRALFRDEYNALGGSLCDPSDLSGIGQLQEGTGCPVIVDEGCETGAPGRAGDYADQLAHVLIIARTRRDISCTEVQTI